MIARASGLEGACLPTLRLAKHRADQAVEQIDGLIGQAGGQLDAGSDQCRVPSLTLISGDMLRRHAASLAGELRQACLVNVMSTSRLDANRPDMLQAFEQADHGDRFAGLWHLSQPGQPSLAGVLAILLPALRQRIEALALVDRQAVGQAAMHLPPRLMTYLDAEAFKRRRPGNDDPTMPALLQHQGGQMHQPVVLDGVRQQPGRQQRRRAWPKRAQPQPVLQLGGMGDAAAFCSQISIDRLWKHVDLFCDECEQRCRRPLAGAQRAARIAQVAQHQRMAEPVMVAARPPDRRQVGVQQGVVAHQITLFCRRIEHPHDLGVAQLLPPRHSCLLDLCGRQTSRSGPGSRSRCCA